MKSWPAFLLVASLHLLENRVTLAVLWRTRSHNGHLIVRRDTSAQEGSGSFVDIDVAEDSAINLESALQNVSSHTTIHLEPGNHTINEFILVQNVMNITLEGDANEEGVSILCAEDAGLAFINVSYLTIRNITIDGCGFTGADIENTVAILNDTVNIFLIHHSSSGTRYSVLWTL